MTLLPNVSSFAGCACLALRWNGTGLLIWYCANGAEITLRSIVSACP
jgi:hypothetical protein